MCGGFFDVLMNPEAALIPGNIGVRKEVIINRGKPQGGRKMVLQILSVLLALALLMLLGAVLIPMSKQGQALLRWIRQGPLERRRMTDKKIPPWRRDKRRNALLR